MPAFLVIRQDPAFPAADVAAIGARLSASRILVPGFLEPPGGLLDLRAIARDTALGAQYVILPDRNLASRMAWVAANGLKSPLPTVDRHAIDLMAFAQAMNMMIEPSIAFHELADCQENASAQAELAWFRTADRGDARAWIALAQGRTRSIAFAPPPAPGPEDLAFPLKRFRRNYVATLKIAELELTALSPVERVTRFYDWMYEDFQWCGPASLFAALYFAPGARRKGLLKDLRSPDRRRALKGARNAAWDITHLSDFAGRLRDAKETDRYIFASADILLTQLAGSLLGAESLNDERRHRRLQLGAWWPRAEAALIADKMVGCVEEIEAGRQPRLAENPTDKFIAEGEAFLLRQPSG